MFYGIQHPVRKKVLALLLACLMTCSTAAPAFADLFAFGTVTVPEPEPVYTDGNLTAGSGDYGASVAYTAEAELPEGTQLFMREIPEGTTQYDEYLAAAQATVGEDEQTVFVRFFDLELQDKDGNPLEPAAPVAVNISSAELADAEKVTVVHFPTTTTNTDAEEKGVEDIVSDAIDVAFGETKGALSLRGGKKLAADIPMEGVGRSVEAGLNSVEEVTDGPVVVKEEPLAVEEAPLAMEEVVPEETGEMEIIDAETSEDGILTFLADGFSVYGIVGTRIVSVDFLTADGETLKVTVAFSENEVIPKGANLEITEISKEDDAWMDRSIRLGKVLQDKYGYVVISDARFLDIKIKIGDEEFEPQEPVEVRVVYTEEFDTDYTYDYVDPEFSTEESKLGAKHFVMVHYTDDVADVLESDITEGDGCITESISKTPSFSEYDIAYFTEDKIDNIDRSGVLPDFEIAGKSSSGLKLLGATRSAGAIPSHNKNLDNKGDGTYEIHLNVTGDADTTSEVSNVNVIIVYDTSTSMNNSHNYDPYNVTTYTQNNTGRYGTDGNGNYINLYYQSSTRPVRYSQLNNDTYSGTVYSNANGTRYDGIRYTRTRTTRADVAEPVVRNFVNSLYSYQNEDDPTNIQTTFITFNGSPTQRASWTTNPGDITGYLVADGTNGSYNHASGFYASGTNWERALRAVQTALNNKPDNDPTYVVFITDGAPTTSATITTVGTQYEQCYIDARDEALAIQTAVNATGGDFYSIYAYGDETDWLATMMYYANNNGVEPANGRGTTFSTKGYYNAANTAALSTAISEIFDAIVDTLGITSVSIEDGTTSNVELSTGSASADLLDVNTDSFRYTLSWNVTSNGDGTYGFTMPDKISGENIAYTVSASGSNITITWDGGSAEYTGKLEVGKLTIDWTASTNFYKFAPPTAQFVDPNVIWNLNSVGTLLNGVTYDVAFECYPSQYTLDLVADLKNGYVEYNNLDENIKKYLKNEDGDYVLATNTSASLTYTDTRTENGEQTAPYTNPKPQKTTATKSVTVSKDWNNILDDRTKPESLTMNVTRDGVDRYELVLNDSNHWQKSSFISFGIMTIHNGEIVMKTTGHDYSFSEPNAFGYYWELDVPTLRPMLINSVETMLVKVDESEAPSMEGANATAVGNDGYNYYKLTIDGTAYYYKVDEAIASLRAVNNRRSYLNLTKVVDETNAPSDALFTYNIQIKDSNGEDVWFAAQTVEDAAANNETYQLLTVSENVTPEFRTVSGATYNSETNTYRYTYDGKTYILPAADDGTGGYMYTGYYSVDSDQAFTIQMPAGWNVRFINLPTGTTYSITEGAMPEESFSLESITGNRHYKDNEGTVKDEVVGKVSGSTISGSIEYSNSDYKMTFDNKYSTIDVQLKKVDENTKLLSGSEFSLIAMKLNDGNLVEKGNIIGTFTPGTNDVANPADLGGLGIGYYRLTETKSPAGYNILTKYVYLEVYKDADDGTLKARLTNEIGTPIDSMDEATITSSGSESLSYTITVKNYPGVALPSTGSSRTLLYTVFGLTMLLTVGAVLTVRTRKEN